MFAILYDVVRLEKPGTGEITAIIGPGETRLVEQTHCGENWLCLEGEENGLPAKVWACLATAGFLTFSTKRGQA